MQIDPDRAECHVREHPPLQGEGHGDDEEHEQSHLRHQEQEDLVKYVRILRQIAEAMLGHNIRGCSRESS